MIAFLSFHYPQKEVFLRDQNSHAVHSIFEIIIFEM